MVLDPGATGLKGTVTINGQGTPTLTDPIQFSTTANTAAPFVVSEPGPVSFTITVALPDGKTQQLTLSDTIPSNPTTSTGGCTPRQ